MPSSVSLPRWPKGTVGILSTAGTRPHAIPVSAILRAGPDRILIGLAHRRDSLARLRADPEVTLAVCAEGLAFSADGTATVIAEQLTERVAAVAITVHELHDHDRPTFAIQSGVGWHWTNADAADADAAVHAALSALA